MKLFLNTAFAIWSIATIEGLGAVQPGLRNIQTVHMHGTKERKQSPFCNTSSADTEIEVTTQRLL